MRTLNIFLIVVLVLVGAFAAQAGTADDVTVNVINRTGKLAYYGTVTIEAADSTGEINYTQAMYIGGVNASDALGRFVCTGTTADQNVFVEYSIDGTTWTAGTTDTDLDALGNTAVVDTFGMANGTNEGIFHTFMWMRLKFVAGQDVTVGVVSWAVVFIKPNGIEQVRLHIIKDVT